MNLVPGFTHRPGRHCGSVAAADVLLSLGLELTEPMCFGLGSGLGFLMICGLAPSRMFWGRSAMLEVDLFTAVGAPCSLIVERDAEKAWQSIREQIDRGQPVMVQCDLKLLPYWKARSPFNGHRVVVAGYDAERGVAALADTHFEEIQEVSLEDLAAARSSFGPPVGSGDNLWFDVSAPSAPPDLGQAIPRAISRLTRRLLNLERGHMGMDAVDAFAAELPSWPDQLKDWPHCVRSAYQYIVTRGTGGDCFRGLYRDFLEEAAALVPALARSDLPARMATIASGWSEVGDGLREASEELAAARERGEAPPRPDLETVAAAMTRTAAAERRWLEDAQDLFGEPS